MDQPDASPKILVAPLDWGLGHATRCIPMIHELLRQRCRVVLAASGRGKTLLQQEFPTLEMLHLPGYEMEYAATAWGLTLKIVAQIPRLLSAIKKEQAWLQKVVEEARIDAVISDNRFGLHHPGITSVFITHQLRIKAPLALAEDLLQKLNYQYINRFNECWVPDNETANNLAGELSHPLNKPAVPLRFTGPLSRFGKKFSDSRGKHLLFLLSGPEPQRTLLEQAFLDEVKDYTNAVVFVRGLPGATEPLPVKKNVIVHHHLSAAALEPLIADASFVISRCGYSTVMDLAAMQKKSILIPTPGQTEQEYLAKHLMQKKFALCVDQKKFRLKNVLALAETFPYRSYPSMNSRLNEVVEGFIKSVQSRKAGTVEKFAKSI